MSENHPSLQFAFNIAKENAWMKFQDVAIKHGLKGTSLSLKLLCLTVFGDRNSPASDSPYIIPETCPLCKHFLQCHTDLPSEITLNDLTNCIISTITDSKQFLNILPPL